MDIEIKTWLYDIKIAIQEIESFLSDKQKETILQLTDIKTRRAIERDIEIIGEAMSRILQKDASINLSNSRKIVDTRNRIIHGYESVSDEILSSIILQHLPVLKLEVEKFSNEQ
jgi:uncharacterized protein with HEPN domain